MNQPSSFISKRWLAVLSLVIGIVLGARAESVEIGGLYYELDPASKTATVTYQNTSILNYKSLQADVVIPSTVKYDNENYSVTSIGREAFALCTNLESIVIPSSITKIGYRSFNGCSGLKSVDMPNSVTEIVTDAFYGCESLTQITIPASIERIADYAFANCSSLEMLTLEDSNEALGIGLNVFRKCPLESLYLGRNIELTGSYDLQWDQAPFINKTELKNVEFGLNVTELNFYAFEGCSSLEEITLPDNITLIGGRSFYGCTSLREIVLPNNLNQIGGSAFYGCSNLSTIDFPNSLTEIGSYAFYENTSLQSLTLPTSLELIDEYCFSRCSGITNLTIPSNVKEIRTGAFNVSSIKNLTIEDGDLSLRLGYGYDNSTSDYIVNSTPFYKNPIEDLYIGRDIDGSGFNGISTLEHLSFGNNVNSMGCTFSNCTSLESVEIPGSIATLPKDAFYGCTNLKNLRIESGEKELKIEYGYDGAGLQIETVFKNCPIANLYLNRNLDSEHCPFLGMTTLNKVEFGTGISQISKMSFYNCSGIASIVIPSTIEYIGEYAFNGCTSLKDVTIVDGENPLTIENVSHGPRVETTVFDKCPIESLYVGRNVISEISPFRDCKELTNVAIGNLVTQFPSYFISRSMVESVALPESIRTIGDFAFYGCDNLVELSIPSTTSDIGRYAFAYCPKLKSFTIPGSIDRIKQGVFEGCTGIKEITIPAEVSCIENGAFLNANLNSVNFADSDNTLTIEDSSFGSVSDAYIGRGINCDILFGNSLESIHFGNNVSEIPDRLLYGCSSLTELSIPCTIRTIGEHALDYCTSLKQLIFEDGSEPLTVKVGYTSSGYNQIETLYIGRDVKWEDSPFEYSKSLHTVEFGNQVTHISDRLFYGSGISGSIIIPENIVEIGEKSFSNCESLTELRINGLNTNIGSRAFSGCTNLKEIVLPEKIGDIGEGALYCTAIESIILPESLEVIPRELFGLCRNLKTISLPSSLKVIGANAFYGCESLTSIEFNESLEEIGELSFNGCRSLASVILPESLKVINDEAFVGCSRLQELSLSEGLERIGNKVFYRDTEIASPLIIPSTVEFIGDEAFEYCNNIASIEIRDGKLKEIGNETFRGCVSATKLILPSNISSIGESAFGYCNNLRQIRCEGTVPPIGEPDFTEFVVNNATLFVPASAFNSYSTAATWKDFCYIRPITNANLTTFVKFESSIASVTDTSSKKIQAVAGPETADNTGVLYRSEDEEIATVDHTGLVTGKKVGTVFIYAFAADGSGEYDKCYVHVIPTYISSIEIASEETLRINQSMRLRASVTPYNATTTDLIWYSSSPAIVSVDETGNIFAHKPGQAIITSMAVDDGHALSECKITVLPPAKGDSNENGFITISDAVNTANYAVGNEVENFNVEAADVNEDNRVTLSDASATVAIVLDQPVQTPAMAKVRALASATTDESDLLVIDDYSAKPGETTSVFVTLDNTLDYVALQADVTVPECMTLAVVNIGNRAEANHSLAVKRIDDRTMRIALFDINNSTFADNNEAILELIVKVNGTTADRIEINNILASDAQAHEYVLTSTGGNNADMSGIDNVGYSNIRIETTTDGINIYNADGYEVAIYAIDGTTLKHFVASSDFESRKVVPGVYVVAAGNKVEKVMVK